MILSFDAYRWRMFWSQWFWIGHAAAGNIKSEIFERPLSAYVRAKETYTRSKPRAPANGPATEESAYSEG
jgi:hypothetical protein